MKEEMEILLYNTFSCVDYIHDFCEMEKKISKTLSLIKNYISLKYEKNVTSICIHSYDQVSNISKFTLA